MHEPTERVRRAERSRIRVMYDLAEETDRELIRLEVGEPDFDTPDRVVDAAAEAARGGATHYTTNAGMPACRRAIRDAMAADYGVEHDVDEILVTVGGMEALHLATLATVGPGEELLYPGPAWPNYETQAFLADGRGVEVPMPAETGFALDGDRLAARMGPETGAVVLTTPSNPTGRVYDPGEIRTVVEAAADHGAYVVADEVYAGLTYDREPQGIAALTDHPEHVLTVGSCSKTYAMTGWRLGWLAGDRSVLDQTTKVRESTTACASSVAQHAAIEALTGPQEPFEEMYDAFRRRRDYVVDRVADIDGLSAPRPEGAFYAFLDPDVEAESLAFAKYLLTDHGVVLAPGSGFGTAGEGRLRLSFANSMDRLEAGLDRIAAGIAAY
ncbi:aminotransferase class I/II [Halobacteriales archaeon QS_8_69_73]|nr:MAG: aminotransferase class I/II [Halobacteriales archaeon QS_8_69_73]